MVILLLVYIPIINFESISKLLIYHFIPYILFLKWLHYFVGFLEKSPCLKKGSGAPAVRISVQTCFLFRSPLPPLVVPCTREP